MGYHINLIESEFKISKSTNENCETVEKLKKFFLDNVNEHGSGGSFGKDIEEKWYAWVDNDEIKNAKTIADLLMAFRYEASYDEEGNIDDVYFNGEKLGDDEFFFSNIAPYVEKGSYLVFQGEEESYWKWVFNGKKMKEKAGRVVFDD